MNIIKEIADEKHQISDVRISLSNSDGAYRAKWSFKQSDGFFVVAYPYNRSDFDYIELISSILSEYDTEKNIRVNHDDVLFMCIGKSSVSNSGIEIVKKKDVDGPKKITVLAYSKENNDIKVYTQERDFQCVLPFQINYKINFNRSLSLSGIVKKEIVFIKPFKAFREDILYYSVQGCIAKYPISKDMIGKEFSVQVEHGGTIDLKVSEKYKQFFKCVIG